MNTKTVATIAVIIILIVAGIAYVELYRPFTKPSTTTTTTTTSSSSSTATSATVAYPVALTDPPSVPYGTSALWLNYTAVELITNSSPLFANYSGSVNLLSLVNQSKILAVFNLSRNVTVNQIRLIVSSAYIYVNGTKYPVFLPSGVLKIPVHNATAGALVDLQPHVVVAYVGQTPEYILTPVATAIPFNTTAKPGQTVPLSSQVVNKLNRIFSNLTVVSSSLTYKGNVTSFSITVKNNGNEPVVIYAVRLFGEWQTQINAEFNSSQFEHSGFNFSNMFSQGVPAGFNGTMTHSMPVVFFVINNTLQPFPNAPVNPHRLHFFGTFKHMGPFNFTPNFQFNESEFNYTPPVWHGDFGIIVQPGQSVTLNFTGVITPLWHGWHFRSPWFTKIDIYTVPVNGYQYQIKLMSVPPSNSTYYVTAKEI